MFWSVSINAHLVWTAQQQQMIDRIEWSEERNKQEKSWISEQIVNIIELSICSFIFMECHI